MTSLSSLSRAFACICVAAIAAITGIVAALLAVPSVQIAALGVAAISACLAAFFFRALRRFLGEVGRVSRSVAVGDFEARIFDVAERGNMGGLRDAINGMIDRCDAFVRESSAAMSAVCRGRYYRRFLPLGMHGA